MDSLPDTPSDLQFARSWVPVSGKGAVSDYLDEFCLPLYEVATVLDVEVYRLLVAEQVTELIAEFRAKGWGPHGAIHAALREHGDAYQMGILLRNEFLRDRTPRQVNSLLSKPAKQAVVVWFLMYLFLAWIMGNSLHKSVSANLIFLVSSVVAGCLAGTIASLKPLQPVLWGGLAGAYPLILTTLILFMQKGLAEVSACMVVWVFLFVLTAIGILHFWQVRRQREIYRQILA